MEEKKPTEMSREEVGAFMERFQRDAAVALAYRVSELIPNASASDLGSLADLVDRLTR